MHRLEREMRNAFEADKKYSRENDAKFRAIHQRVATYEEFRSVAMETDFFFNNAH